MIYKIDEQGRNSVQKEDVQRDSTNVHRSVGSQRLVFLNLLLSLTLQPHTLFYRVSGAFA